MADNKRQQQQPRIEVELTLAGPVEKDGKNYVSGIVKARRGNDVLADEDVRYYVDGQADSIVETTDEAGQSAKEFEIAGFGNHTLQAFFPRLAKWTHPRGFTLKKPEAKKETDEDPFLFVWPVRVGDQYHVTVTVKVNERRVLKVLAVEHIEEHVHASHKKFTIHFNHPTEPQQSVETDSGVAVAKFPVPQDSPVRLLVRGAGQTETVLLQPSN